MLEKRDYLGKYGENDVHNYFCSSCERVVPIVDKLVDDSEKQVCPTCQAAIDKLEAKKKEAKQEKIKPKTKPKKTTNKNTKKPVVKKGKK